MAVISVKRHSWNGHRDKDGQRMYDITFMVETNNQLDGPGTITSSPLLPQIGAMWVFGANPSVWNYGVDNDSWAFCTPYIKATPVVKNEITRFWLVSYKFSTVPITRCQDTEVGIPFAEPPKISGGTSSSSRTAYEDKDSDLILNTAHENVGVDFDYSNPTIRITQNINPLNLTALSTASNRVNSSAMWGVGTRRIRLESYSFERRYWGSCTLYYTRTLEFQIDFEGFDRGDVPNICTKMIQGKWDGDTYTADAGRDVNDPTHFTAAKDKSGNLIETHLSKSTGIPTSTPNYLDVVSYYKEYDFTTLGIPATI